VQDAHCAKEIRLKCLLHHVGGDVRWADHDVVIAPLFDGGVVDQYVQSAVGLDGLDGRLHRRVVGDIELDSPRAQLLGGPAPAFGVAAADVDGVAGGGQLAGSLEADALVSSGDQCCCHGSTVQQRRAISQPASLPRTVSASDGSSAAVHSGVMARTEFGHTVRRWRDRVSPEAAGLPVRGHRRAAGLRREELAQLAGISVDYVTRLEQGRATNPSEQVVEALGRALRVSTPEREHLFHIAGLMPPGQGTVPAYITPGVQRMLDRLTGTPVAVFDAACTLLLANPLYVALMGEHRGNDRNAVWRNFLGSGSRVRHTPESLLALKAAQVAELRAAANRYPADQRVRRLVAELRANSDHFAKLWDSGIVGGPDGARKTIDHPQVGPMTLDCDVLSVAGPDLRIMVYTAEPGTKDAEQMALLAVLGTQTLVEGPSPLPC
jgi:transcriptional regulator with XRE-family HTH domain